MDHAARSTVPRCLALLLTPLFASAPCAGDWSNAGGNAGRNGSTTEVGPENPTLLWSGGRTSSIAWQPVTEGGRVFVVRQSSLVPNGVPNDSPVVAMDLETGAELWSVDLPFNAGEWTTWVAGVANGQVYACRGGNGSSSSARLHALDAADGSLLWTSDTLIDAGGYDGVVFAPDGDPVIGSFGDIWRIESSDGSTVWRVPRTCSVSSSCGVALFGEALYGIDGVGGGHVLERYHLTTGTLEYQSAVMPGLFVQNGPMVAPDGTVYVNRVQNNPSTDFLYAFDDTGTELVQRWSVPAGFNALSEYAVGPDGSVYMLGANGLIQRLDSTSGAVLDSAPFENSGSPIRMATDALGRVYVSKGSSAPGRMVCFEADLTLRWSLEIPNLNIGAPALGRDGTLILAATAGVRAYRNPLAQDRFSISAGSGGVQTLKLHEPSSPGQTYWILGSVSGTSPGLMLGGVLLPLNPDWYLRYSISNANGPLLLNTRGVLDANGDAVAQFVLPPGLVSPGAPITVQHAFAVVDTGTSTASAVSNAATLKILP